MYKLPYLILCIFFISCASKNRNKSDITESDSTNIEHKKYEFINKLDENCYAPYLSDELLEKIIDGHDDVYLNDDISFEIPNKYTGNISDIFPKGQAYIIDLNSILLVENMVRFNKTLDKYSNSIYINVSPNDSSYLVKNKNEFYALLITDSCKFIPYKRSTYVYLSAINYFDINDVYSIDFDTFNNSIKYLLE